MRKASDILDDLSWADDPENLSGEVYDISKESKEKVEAAADRARRMEALLEEIRTLGIVEIESLFEKHGNPDIGIVFTKVMAGYYKANVGKDALGAELFANVIRREKSKWNADIRVSSSGEVVRFAGVWDSRKEAMDEVLRIARHHYY